MSSFFVNANTDTTAISNLLRTQVPLRTTIERLSTGLYVPSTEEDAAGFVVADKVTNVVGVSKTIETTSRLQTADQALGSLQAKLARLRNLAGRAAEESTAEPSLSDEFRSVMGSVDEVASAAGLGKGGELARQLAVNIGNDTPTAVDLSGATADTESLGLVSGTDISTTAGAKAALAGLESASRRLAEVRGMVGGAVQKVAFAVTHATELMGTGTWVGNQVADAASAHATASVTRDSIVGDAATARATQANLESNVVFNLLQS